MKASRRALLLIILITVVAFIIDLPEGLPVQFTAGPIKVNRIVSPPHIQIPQLGIDRKIETHLGLDLQGGMQLVLEAEMQDVPKESRTQALESAREVVERRVNFFGVSEPVVQTAQVNDSYRIIVELPGLTNPEQAVELIGQTAQLEFREYIENASPSGQLDFSEVTKPTGITGKDLKRAQLAFDSQTGEPIVDFELTPEGGKKFGEVTTRLVGKPLAIFLDDLPISSPVVRQPITDSRGTISGGFTIDEAKKLALQLSAGALPTPIKIIEQRSIGATLGSVSVEKSIRAGLIGLGFVAAFMILYYGSLGLIADTALIIYGLITFALFRLIPITLSLPGIAGFVLSIGMAVDSNILIFARYHEERAKGNSWQIAMELAFGRAWDSIRDANFTTIITAFILYNPLNWSFIPASGIVRGFALTLAIGVLVSLFTGIFVTRNLIRIFYRPQSHQDGTAAIPAKRSLLAKLPFLRMKQT
ncbi:MAG: Preprotein translocase subunit SecD [Candidatus Gottesmanbacteria bacterium GW2011_GWA1_43_11]|uniref:Protein translocase subunit SecD n=1 Tax=Candidatus Gottesmanbacteria bacterium GW2011_GWA1_43_11 TaxID=1618436 RepID=A0A0G1CJ04_9BACT|nr:MAG: Preprotein translocase subunit SecD [Candidatus Gottesmanbacteria bacterium GW2011_GWA1_43_11]